MITALLLDSIPDGVASIRPPRQSAVTAPRAQIFKYFNACSYQDLPEMVCRRDSNSLVLWIWCNSIHCVLPRTSGKFKGKLQYLKYQTCTFIWILVVSMEKDHYILVYFINRPEKL